MSSTSTTWTEDAKTAATALTTSNAAVSVAGTLTVEGAFQLNSTLTVGVDDTGYDVKFFGATSGAYILWDESTDDLKIVGGAGIVQSGAGVNVFTGSSAFGTNSYLTITDNEIDVSSGDLTIDVAGDVTIDADGGDFKVQDAGTSLMHIKNGSNVLIGLSAGASIHADATGNIFIGKEVGDASMTSTADENVGIGSFSLSALTSGSHNTSVGKDSLKSITSGVRNIALGSQTLENDTDGTANIAIGHNAMNACTNPGNYNVAIGYQAMDTDGVEGGNNIAIGSDAMGAGAVTASSQVAVGQTSLFSLTSGTLNIGIGYRAGYALTTGDSNIAIGYDALLTNIDGDNNIAIGYRALYEFEASSDGDGLNLAIGTQAGQYVSTGTRNTFLGQNAGRGTNSSELTGVGNTCVGNHTGNALITNATGNTLMGVYCGDAITTGDYNVAMGQSALSSAQDVDACVTIGTDALKTANHVFADGTVAIGKDALEDWNPSSGSANEGQMTAVGYGALANAVDGSSQNTAVGYTALQALTTATQNIGVGNQALKNITTNGSNVAVGHAAGQNCTDDNSGGTSNVYIGNAAGQYVKESNGSTFVGAGAGYSNAGSGSDHLDGDYNTLIGFNSGNGLIIEANNNTFLGAKSGQDITIGDDNVIIGYLAGSDASAGALSKTVIIGANAGDAIDSTDADGTVLVGYDAGTAITSGQYNTAIGTYALDATDDGDNNVAVGYQALSANCGNNNTAIGKQALTLSTEAGSVAVGHETLEANTDGLYNVAVGYRALRTNAQGDSNTAIGYEALTAMNPSGGAVTSNTAVGKGAGQSVTTGTLNTFVGASAGDALTIGDNNIAIGNGALGAAVEDSKCVAVGVNAFLNAVNSGSGSVTNTYNTGVGESAGLYVSTGTHNTFIGGHAGLGITGTRLEGAYNTTVGFAAGYLLQGAATQNTLIGRSSGDSITTGSNNTLVGESSDASSATGVNQTVIGSDATGIGDNYAVIGDAATTRVYAADDVGATLYAGSATVSTSDARIKEDIQDTVLGLGFINKLRAVEYKKRQPIDYDESLKKELNWYKKGRKPRTLDELDKNKSRTGFIAQEVGEVLKDIGFDDNNDIIAIDETNTQQHIAYSKIVPPLVKAVQELSAQVEELKSKLGE